MPNGSCMCGTVKFELIGEPVDTSICHCGPCHKCAGANGSTNLIVEPEHLRVTGEMRTWTRKGISGQDVIYNFCTTCPTIVFVQPLSFAGRLVVKAGLLDSMVDIRRTPPKTELFVKDRLAPWCERGNGVTLLTVD